jgi:hypothetical protein
MADWLSDVYNDLFEMSLYAMAADLMPLTDEEQGILNWHPHGQPWTSAVEELVPAGEF